jgi:hypothetical protein
MICATRRAVLSDADAACEVVRRSIVDLCQADHHGDSDILAKWLANKTPANFLGDGLRRKSTLRSLPRLMVP